MLQPAPMSSNPPSISDILIDLASDVEGPLAHVADGRTDGVLDGRPVGALFWVDSDDYPLKCT